MIPNCFIARLRKLDKGELFLFLDYRYLWGGSLFLLPDFFFGVLFSFRPPTMG